MRGIIAAYLSLKYVYEMHLFSTWQRTSFPAAGPFSCSRLRGTQRARVYTRHKFGPRPGSVARALGVQSRGELVLSRGCFPPSQSQAVRWKSTQKKASSFFSRVLLCITVRTSETATLQQQPRFKLFLLWQRRSMLLRCVRVCACVCVPPDLPGDMIDARKSENKHLKTSGAILALHFQLFRSAVCCYCISITPSSQLFTLKPHFNSSLRDSHGRCLSVCACVPS